MFYKIARGICRFLFKLFYKLEFCGKENIPAQGGYIVAANHKSLADPIFIGLGLKPRIHYMAKKELFFFPLKYIVRALGAFPVDRGTGDTGALQVAENLVNDGKILGIFPEGTRSKDGKPMRPKSGVAVIAKATKAAVLPVHIAFEGKLRFRSHVRVSFGKLISYEELGIQEDRISSLKDASRLIMNRIVELSGDEVKL